MPFDGAAAVAAAAVLSCRKQVQSAIQQDGMMLKQNSARVHAACCSGFLHPVSSELDASATRLNGTLQNTDHMPLQSDMLVL